MPTDFSIQLQRAAAGDADAQFAVAEAYRQGTGADENLSQSLRWYRAAAEQGHPLAQNNLGSMLLNGMGTDKAPEEAARWYRKAAEQGEAVAQFNLAMRYSSGTGVEQNDVEAAHWFNASAKHGHAEATGELGTFYRFGRGVEKNLITAARLHLEAATDGDVTSIGNLADYWDDIRKAALGGSVDAALCMAQIYEHGLGITDKSPAQVFAWVKWAELQCNEDNEPECEDDVEDWDDRVSSTISDVNKQEGNDLLAAFAREAEALRTTAESTHTAKDSLPEPRLPRTPNDGVKRDRFHGCLLGGAVGDALGAPVEFMTCPEIHRQFGPAGIRDYAPAYGRLGAITNDTQMTLFTADGMLRAHVGAAMRDLEPEFGNRTAQAYVCWLKTQGAQPKLTKTPVEPSWLMAHHELLSRRAPGLTCLSALKSLTRFDERARNNSKGCGGVMRVAPIGMFFSNWMEGAEHRDTWIKRTFNVATDVAAITHGHPTGQLTAGVFAVIIALAMRRVPLLDATEIGKAELRKHDGHEETLAAIEHAQRLAAERPAQLDALQELGEGWVADEALAMSLYCAQSARDFESALVLAVNHGGDSDSTGAITGNLLGAALGATAIPERWLERLELADVIRGVADDLATVREWQVGEFCARAERDFYRKRYPGWVDPNLDEYGLDPRKFTNDILD